MGKILFRGKRVDNGEWVEGNFYESKMSGCYILVPKVRVRHKDGVVIGDSFDVNEVIPETIGQYTGLTDKNGNKIFEGDIVDVEYDIQYVGVAAERIGLFEVVFYDGCFMKKKRSGDLFHFIPSDKCQVVGNIHDNHELLEGEK